MTPIKLQKKIKNLKNSEFVTAAVIRKIRDKIKQGT